MLSRAHTRHQDYRLGLFYQRAAVHICEKLESSIVLNRAYNNLAVVMTKQNDFGMAHNLLNHAEMLAIDAEDYVGLAHIRANLQLVEKPA